MSKNLVKKKLPKRKKRSFQNKSRAFRLDEKTYSELFEICMEFKSWDIFFKYLISLHKDNIKK